MQPKHFFVTAVAGAAIGAVCLGLSLWQARFLTHWRFEAYGPYVAHSRWLAALLAVLAAMSAAQCVLAAVGAAYSRAGKAA